MLINILIIFASLLFLYLMACLSFYIFQYKLIFKPDCEKVYDASDFELPEKSLFIPAGDHQIHLCEYVHSGKKAPWLIFFHGNSGNLSGRLDTIKLLYDQGFNCLIFDYRGYGQSSGSACENSLYADAETTVHYLEKRSGQKAEDFHYFGRSLGGAVAIETALRIPPKQLVIESTFTSIPELGQFIHPYIPAKLLSRIHFNNKAKITQLKCPIEIIHSPDDELIPFFMAEELKEAAKLKEVHRIAGDHGEGYASDLEAYRNLLAKVC